MERNGYNARNVLCHMGFVGAQRKRSSHQCLAKYVCVLGKAQVYGLPVPFLSLGYTSVSVL